MDDGSEVADDTAGCGGAGGEQGDEGLDHSGLLNIPVRPQTQVLQMHDLHSHLMHDITSRVGVMRSLVFATIVVSTAILAAGAGTANANTPAPQPIPAAQPINTQADWNNAIGVVANNTAVATAAGATSGAIAGLVGGCVLGAVTGAVLTPPIFFPGALGGCVAGAGVGAGIGGAVGTIIAVVPVGIASVGQGYQMLHAAGDIAAPIR